jgi:hypothetical protein
VSKESNSTQNGKKFSRKGAKDAKEIFKPWFKKTIGLSLRA